MSGTDSAGDVHFLMHHVVPESFAGFQQTLILRCPCHIRHTRIEIYGAYGVSLHLILLTHRAVRLIVAISFLALRAGQTAFDIVIVRFCSAFVDEVLRKIEIFLLPGQIIETHQCHLCNLMTRITRFFALAMAELAGNEVRETLSCFQETVFSGRLIVSYRALSQMAEAVQLVVVLEIRKNHILIVDQIIGVEISVLSLRCADSLNRFICCLFQLRIRMLCQGVGNRLHPLGEIRILEQKAIKSSVHLTIFGQCLKGIQRIFHLDKFVSLCFPLFFHFTGAAVISHTEARCCSRNIVI